MPWLSCDVAVFNVCYCYSLRAQFAVEGVTINQLHGAASEDLAENEILHFFPVEQTFAIIKPDAYESKGQFLQSAVMHKCSMSFIDPLVMLKHVSSEFSCIILHMGSWEQVKCIKSFF